MDETSPSFSQQENRRKKGTARLARNKTVLFLSVGFFMGIFTALLVIIFMPTPMISSQLQAGDSHMCVITDQGGVKCRGSNDSWQLGNPWFWFKDSTDWVQVAGLDHGVREIALGSSHACALMDQGEVRCWGQGNSMPWPVMNLNSKAASIVAGDDYTCAVVSNGGVKCWVAEYRATYFGHPGNEREEMRVNEPQDIQGLGSGVKKIAAGTWHTCALMNSGGVKCWGANYAGQLGNGETTMYRKELQDVQGLENDVKEIAAGGRHTCALMNSGSVKCWGANNENQMGDGKDTGVNVPQEVAGLGSDVTKIVARGDYTCALLGGGSLKCWGDNNLGQLGNGHRMNTITPQEVFGLSSGVQAVTAGGSYTCALMSNGNVKCWGSNESGQIGNTWTKSAYMPQDAPEFEAVVSTLIAFTRWLVGE